MRLRADRLRLGFVLGPPGAATRNPGMHYGFLCVLLYRISNYLFRAGHTFLSRLCWQLNFYFTGASISGQSDIGEGLVILNPAGVSISGNAGRNLTMMACSGLGSELGRWDEIGAGPGLPILGDDVVLEPHSAVLGPVRIGSRVRIAAGIVVTQVVPDDTLVASPPPRFLRRREAV